MSKRILFFGNERLATGVTTAAPALQDLIAHGYEVAAVVVAQSPLGASRRARPLEVALIAEQHGIPLLSVSNLQDSTTLQQLAAYQAQAAVLIAYGKIVPQAVLDIFPRGIINIHPSLLPLHRGSTPIESVILDGDHETGVSLMQLSSKMDAGPVYAQEKIVLTGRETKQGLADQLASLGVELLRQHLPRILDGSLTPHAQDETQATYDAQIEKEDGVIDWTKSAERLEREVRAYFGWPRSRTKIGYTDIIITASHVAEGSGQPGDLWLGDGKALGFYTGNQILVIDKLIPTGRNEMTATAFLAGYKPA